MSESLHGRLGEIAKSLEAVATGIGERRGESALLERLRQTQQWCEQVAAHQRGGGPQELVTRLGTVLQAWRDVWPRLGRQLEFRQAVAREARLWSQRVSELAHRA